MSSYVIVIITDYFSYVIATVTYIMINYNICLYDKLYLKKNYSLALITDDLSSSFNMRNSFCLPIELSPPCQGLLIADSLVCLV